MNEQDSRTLDYYKNLGLSLSERDRLALINEVNVLRTGKKYFNKNFRGKLGTDGAADELVP